MATQVSTSSSNPLLDNKIVLQYPAGMVYDDEFIIISIYTDSATTKLAGDSDFVPPVQTSPDDKPISFPQSVVNTAVAISVALTPTGDAVLDAGLSELNKVIVLPMPNDHNLRTSVEYDADYQPSALVKLGDALNQAGNTIPSMMADLGKVAGAAVVSGIANKIKSGVTSTEDILKNNRLVWNPKKEVMFRDFGFRSFNFTYMFAPKSEAESKMIFEMIQTLRYYSLPEISKSKLFYIFPSEFKIKFMKGKEENPNIPKITSCVLKQINVNYTPQSVWSSLPDGSPVSLQISMEFLEMELVDRNRVFNEKDKKNSGF